MEDNFCFVKPCIVFRAVKWRSFYIPCCVDGKLGESMKWKITEILLIRADEAEQFCYPLQGENACKYVLFYYVRAL